MKICKILGALSICLALLSAMGDKPNLPSHEEGLVNLSKQISAVLKEKKKKRIIVIFFYDDISGRFGTVGNDLVKNITSELVNLGKNNYSVIDQDAQEYIIDEAKKRYSDEGVFSRDTLTNLGKQLNADALVYGFYRAKGAIYEYEARIVNTDTAEFLGIEKVRVDKNTVPRYMQVEEQYYTKKTTYSDYSHENSYYSTGFKFGLSVINFDFITDFPLQYRVGIESYSDNNKFELNVNYWYTGEIEQPWLTSLSLDCHMGFKVLGESLRTGGVYLGVGFRHERLTWYTTYYGYYGDTGQVVSTSNDNSSVLLIGGFSCEPIDISYNVTYGSTYTNYSFISCALRLF
ncbi:MAG: penicillin-binding protein activator LpoB [Candidatus Margulisbacteria bacterium]|jgi:hypothetical protein|nr:penicillin-binding protein activator LpoB [Candidatus Margulisiibacteriota bacterium]